MLRSTSVAALLATLIVAVPSAAQTGSGKIAFRNASGIYTINPDGSARRLVRAGDFQWPGGWSPDGSQLAFTSYTGNPGLADLIVAHPDGSGQRVVATGSISLGQHPWSPDGSRIAWGPLSTGDIFTASAAGGDVRRVTTDGGWKSPPEWSPDGSRLVYSSRAQQQPLDTDLFVVGADGSGRTQITHGAPNVASDEATWSPNGDSIAFRRWERGSNSAIYSIHADGSELHRVWGDTGDPADPAWSPDGTRIAFSSAVNGVSGRYGRVGREIYAIDADGSNLRRLTDLAPYNGSDMTPVWSPDGERVLFARGGQDLFTMNADGTCEERLVGDQNSGVASWQPLPGAPSLGLKRCHAIAVESDVISNVRSYPAYITGAIMNEGTEPLTNIVLVATAPNDLTLSSANIGGHPNACSARRGAITCRAGRLERGQRLPFWMYGDPRRVGLDERSIDVALRAGFSVSADGPLLPTGRESDQIRFTSMRCTPKNRGGGRINGTRFPDKICGRRGADRIHPGEGNDVAQAGDGNDLIFVQDGEPFTDYVSCGRGRDQVVADRRDRVSRDCERVRRR